MYDFPKELQQFIRKNKHLSDFEEKLAEFSKNYFFVAIKEGIISDKEKIKKISIENADIVILIFRNFFAQVYPEILCECAKKQPHIAVRYISEFLKKYNYEIFEYCVILSPKEALHFLSLDDKNLFSICCLLEPEFALTKHADLIKKISGKLLKEVSYICPKLALKNLSIRSYLSNHFPDDLENLKNLVKEST